MCITWENHSEKIAKEGANDSPCAYQQYWDQKIAFFFDALKTVVITLMISDAKSADQNPVTSSFSDQRAVSDNIAALTTKMKSPKVTIDTGKVRTLISEPKIELIRPKSSATQRYVVKLPLTVIPGTASVAIHIAKASTAQRMIKFII